MHILLHRGRHHKNECVGDDRRLIKKYTLVPCRGIDRIDYDIDSSKERSRGVPEEEISILLREKTDGESHEYHERDEDIIDWDRSFEYLEESN